MVFKHRRIPTGIYDRNFNDVAVGRTIAPILGGPVGSCFPCMKVSEYPYHFVNTEQLVTHPLVWFVL